MLAETEPKTKPKTRVKERAEEQSSTMTTISRRRSACWPTICTGSTSR